MDPRVSIGIPVYNGERYLEEALDSLLAQTHADLELVISDNASTDRTGDICRTYASRDPRIVYHRNERNIGAALNYNRVFELSRGAYFKWASHDDRCAPEFIERCVASLDRAPGAVLCFPRTTVIDEHGDRIPMQEDHLPLDSPDVVERFVHCLDPMKLCHNPVFGLMRREILARTRLIGPFLASDRCLVAELSLFGPFVEIPDLLFFRRKHGENIGVSLKHLQFYDPGHRKRFVMPEWKVFAEFLRSVRTVPLGMNERIRLTAAVVKWAAANRAEFEWEVKGAIKNLVGIR